jgi:uncharacterized phage infection (PIP) family protein YhgE
MARKPADEEDDIRDDEEDEVEDEDEAGDEKSEEDLDAEVQEMVKEFMAIPEVKGLVLEIAKDASKRTADAVRNEAFNKLQKQFDAKFDTLAQQFSQFREALGISSDADLEGDHLGLTKEGLLEPGAVKQVKSALEKREAALKEREAEIEEREKKTREASLEAYRKQVVAEFGLKKVEHLIHGDDEDAIDDSVVAARKALNQMRREFIQEFKSKGWTPPPEELPEGDDAAAVTGESTPTELRSRFGYGPKTGTAAGAIQ